MGGEPGLFGHLHHHISRLYFGKIGNASDSCKLGKSKEKDALFEKCSAAYRKAAAWIANTKSFRAEDLRRPEIKALTEATAAVMRDAINTGITESVPVSLTAYLQRNAHVFSGMKTYTALKETAALLTDAEGKPRPFADFKKDVLRIDKTYNQNYLEAEYQFATHSARMAAQWHGYAQDGDRYDLQYRTASDDRVRASHQRLHNVTLPPSDPFWSGYYPPNGWRCRCTVQQVRKGKYPESDSAEAQKLGETATTQLDKDGKNKGAMFRFNPGKDKALFPPDHPYTFSGNCSTKLSSENDKCRALKIANEEAEKLALKEARTTARNWGKENIPERGKTYSIGKPELPELLYKNADIKAITGKSHKFIKELCAAVPNLPQVLREANFIGSSPDDGGHPTVQQWLYYETRIGEEKSYFNVMQVLNPETGKIEHRIHSVSDEAGFDPAKIKNKT